MNVPDQIVQQFRTVALERLEKVETAWESVLSTVDDSAVALIHREIHTLKGESALLGFRDVNLVCHKLEDLLDVARVAGYAVDDDFDLAVNMALRFMTMLVRKKIGSAQLAGIDLPAFIAQIDRVHAEFRNGRATRSRSVTPQQRTGGNGSKKVDGLRARMTPAAIDLFLEYAASRGPRRNRLRSSWHSMRDFVGVHRALFGTGQLIKHQLGAHALAKELGKQVEVLLDLASSEVTTDVLAALDLAILHLMRNAVDHGIEDIDVRRATGKPATGTIRVCGRMHGNVLELVVADDGGGIAYDKVKERALALGLTIPARASDDGWLDLLCHPRLSTRNTTTAVSGRGVGLDAVRASILEVGGAMAVSSEPGRGTTWKISVPIVSTHVDGHVFRAPDVPTQILVDSSWELVDTDNDAEPVIDLGSTLGFSDGDARGDFVLRFARNGERVAFRSEEPPATVQARKLVVTASSAIAEVITIDGVEALLVRPDQIARRNCATPDSVAESHHLF